MSQISTCKSRGLFWSAWIFILFVSVLDGWWVYYCQEVIVEFERNPMGSTLLALAGGDVWLLLSMKTLGTLFACTCVLVIYRQRTSFGLTIALALATFQFGLLVYLNFA
jgi:hypothetical protein